MSTMTELNQTKASRLKNALTDWREVVLHTNSLLTWDQEWYPGVIAAIVTVFYMAVWYWDPTLVTFIAFSGLFVTMADFLGPKIINQVRILFYKRKALVDNRIRITFENLEYFLLIGCIMIIDNQCKPLKIFYYLGVQH